MYRSRPDRPSVRRAPGRTGTARVTARLRVLRRRLRGDSGMNTAEYAVGTVAAVAFAGVLYKVVTSAPVRDALTAVVERALQ